MIDMETVKMILNKDDYDLLWKKVIHYNEIADDFSVMKDGLNIYFKGTHLIAGIMSTTVDVKP